MADWLVSVSSDMSGDPSTVDFFPFFELAITARADETLLIQELDVRDVTDVSSDFRLVFSWSKT